MIITSQVVTEAETYYFPVIIVKEAAKKLYLGTAHCMLLLLLS